jgi:ferrous iron transport protein B
VVDFVEGRIFGDHVIPWVDGWVASIFSGDGWHYWARELVVGDYGIITLGVTYAIAIVLPIVFLFFLFFSLLEDSGYFPRLALLTDRSFKRIGLNGRAVIPVVLGFACDTMATMVTRVQETKRERVITTALLALAIPCSAQYGVMAAMLADASASGAFGVSYPFLIWAGVVALVFLATGLIASKVVPGEPAGFYMELPPLRLPRPGNVLVKTFARMKWYFLEILPLFVVASVMIWIGRLTGLFDLIIRALEPVVGALGLPDAAAPAFLYGFFRRDFGAAGLFELAESGSLGVGQMLVACVTLTLFLPCVAQLLIMHRERGARTTAIIAAVVVVVAFGVGGLLHGILTLTGGLS